MPTSAAGNKAKVLAQAHRLRRAAGFTLLELLVVVSLVAMATAGATLVLRDSQDTVLEREAQRLSALLESARARSRASGIPVRWRTEGEGFRFDGLPTHSLPGHWLTPGVQAQSSQPVLLGPEPLIAPQAIALRSPTAPEPTSPPRTLWLVTDGLQPFRIQSRAPDARP